MLTLVNISELPSKVRELIYKYAGYYDPIYQADVGYYVNVQLGWPYCIGEVIGNNGIAVYYNKEADDTEVCLGCTGIGRAQCDSMVPPYYREICTCTKNGIRRILREYYRIDTCDIDLTIGYMYTVATSVLGKENEWDMNIQILNYLRHNNLYPFGHAFPVSDMPKKPLKRKGVVIWLN